MTETSRALGPLTARKVPPGVLAGPITPTMLRLALPTIIVLVVQTLVGVAETYFVSFLGTDVLAGVALVFPILMLMQMMSNGGIGGGVSSAIARALGANRREDADALVWHAVVIAGAFGIAFTTAAIFGGPTLYRAMGGTGPALTAALTYSGFVFAGSILIWVAALLSSALRGAGNVAVPARVTLVGAIALLPLSPALIFGWGPLPRLGVAGGGLAVVLYYVYATLALVLYLRSPRSPLRLRIVPLRGRLLKDILGVGFLSAIGTVQVNLTVTVITAAVGRFGADAIAGYGIASRLDYIQIPLLFGLGTAVVTMVGINIGAGQAARAWRIGWIGAAISFGFTEVLGLAATAFPHAWLGLFSDDPHVLQFGTLYIRIVAPFYGVVGVALALYFASQGAKRVLLPVLAGTARMIIAALIGWTAVVWFGASLATLFWIVALGAIVYGALTAGSVLGAARRDSRRAWCWKKKPVMVLGSVLFAVLAAAAFATVTLRTQEAAAVSDPRQQAPVVRLATAARVTGSERGFTGIIGARVQSNLGFRVAGKIVERLVNVGQQVKAGQPLMRIDETDLRLALTAKRNAVAAAQASFVQLDGDERRYAKLVSDGWVSRQRYDQAKAASDTAKAQLAAAEAEARVAENEATYSVLGADADGTVVETLGEPGQVVSAGQTVIRLAQAGPREAVVALPETIRPAIGSVAEASVYGGDGQRYAAHLRQLSDAADALTRTYEARYVLDGDAAAAPLGATVTIRLVSEASQPEVQVPLGAMLDDGRNTGVWLLDGATSTVHFLPVKLVRVTSETAVILD